MRLLTCPSDVKPVNRAHEAFVLCIQKFLKLESQLVKMIKIARHAKILLSVYREMNVEKLSIFTLRSIYPTSTLRRCSIFPIAVVKDYRFLRRRIHRALARHSRILHKVQPRP